MFIFGCWLMNLVINLKLKQKILLKSKQTHKMSTNVTQNDDFFKPDHFDKKKKLLSLKKHLYLSQLEINHLDYEHTVKN